MVKVVKSVMVVNDLHLAIAQGIALGHVWLGSQHGERGWYSLSDSSSGSVHDRGQLRAPTGAVSACDRHSSWRAGLVEIRSGYAVPHNETEEEVRGVKNITMLGCLILDHSQVLTEIVPMDLCPGEGSLQFTY